MANKEKAENDTMNIQTKTMWSKHQIELVGGKPAANTILRNARDSAVKAAKDKLKK